MEPCPLSDIPAYDGKEGTGIYNFSNIRYAQSPVGPRRFSAPKPPAGRLEDIQVGEEGRICPQSGPEWTLVSAQFSEAVAEGRTGSFNMTEAVEIASEQIDNGRLPSPDADDNPYLTEDCLFLDVVVPSAVFDKQGSSHEAHPAHGAPVVVWYDSRHDDGSDLYADVWAPGFTVADMSGGIKSTKTAVTPPA